MPVWLNWERSFRNFDLFELSSFSPKVFLKLLSGTRLCIPISDEKKTYAWCNMRMLCNAWFCTKEKCQCIKFILFILSLLGLPLSQTCYFTGQSFQSFPLSLESTWRLPVVSYLIFYSWKQTSFWFDPSSKRHWTFHLHALDFTTLALSMDSTWIMKNH